MTKYTVYGDYGLASECLLEEFDTYKEAERWAERYVAGNDFDHATFIDIVYFTEDGEAITHYIFSRGDFEAFGGADDFYEGDDDFALIDEF
jgi:hypothetical protein